MRTRILLALMILTALSFLGYSAVSSFLSPHLVLEKKRGLGERETIAVETGPAGDVFHLGDAISYFVKIEYRLDGVEEIDKTSLDRNIILDPFEIKDLKEKDSRVNSDTRMHLREYEVQLLDGQTNYLYTFPTIILRYKLKNSGWFEKKIVPQPIFIGARLPADVTDLELKPLKGEVINMDRERIPWILWSLGFLGLVLGMTEVLRILRRRGKEGRDYQRRIAGLEDLLTSFQELSSLTSAEKALHGAHQILRALLARREGTDWLNPELDKIPPEIKSLVSDLLEKCQKAYQREAPKQEERQEALEDLGKILNFYTGKGEV